MSAPRLQTVVDPLVATCDRVGLDETNRLAKMLVRTDNKYLLSSDQFAALADQIADAYFLLQIEGITQFTYSSCYYDDHFGCYFEHHQSRRQRFKVRTREYVDSGLKFFEIKLKGKRGVTQKHRVGCDDIVMPEIRDEKLQMLYDLYRDRYKKAMAFTLKPALIVNYKRCTLVFKQGGERVTIDYGLTFRSMRAGTEPVILDDNFIIVETKSKDGRGETDLALKHLGIRKARKCSKYCIGVNLTGEVRKNNVFLPTIRRARNSVVHATPVSSGVAA